MNVGGAPWHQANWDWRAAGNFVFGGAGAGLLFIAAAVGVTPGVPAALRLSALLLGLTGVGVGLLCVLLKIGRPLRALNVFLQPRRSWMSREAFVALLLTPLTLFLVWRVWPVSTPEIVLSALVAALALIYAYCQGRILSAAKGIPAWRAPSIVGLLVTTSWVEGASLWLLLCAALSAPVSMTFLWAWMAALMARQLAAWQYRGALRKDLAAGPARAVLRRGDAAFLGLATALPLAVGLAASAGVPSLALALAAVLALLGGSVFKHVLITRAGFNQGYALAHFPVRGQPRAHALGAAVGGTAPRQEIRS